MGTRIQVMRRSFGVCMRGMRASGQQVSAPNWREGDFGRGLMQFTHHDNRVKLTEWFSKKLYLPNVDFTNNPGLLLGPELSALAAYEGMIHGLFRNGHWLASKSTRPPSVTGWRKKRTRLKIASRCG